MKSLQLKIILFVIGGWFLAGGFFLIALQAPFLYYAIFTVCALLGSLGIILFTRHLYKLIGLISNGLEIIESGNLNYRVGLDRQDIFGKQSRLLDHLAEMLVEKEKSVQNLEMDNEVFVDRIRETHSIQERFQKLFENPNYGIFLCDFEGSIIDVNGTGCKLLDYDKDELLDISFYNLYAPGELTRTINATKIGAQQQAIRFESKFLTKTKQMMDVEISSNIYDFQNEIIQNIVSDISQRKQVEHELKQSEEKFRSFMESANDLMFITDAAETFVYANQAMIHALGIPIEELQMKKLSDLSVSESDISTDPNSDKLNVGKMKELIWRSNTGSLIYGELMTSVILNDNNDCIGFRGVFRDVTERKKISESRRLAQLGRLMADVAHEVKNRLMAIMGIVEYIHLEYKGDPEIINDMLMIHEECRTMDDFVRQMLNFSRPSEGIYQETDIHMVLDSVLKLIAKSLKRDQIKVQKEYNPDMPKIVVDEKQMSEVFMNLIQNAHEAMEKGGHLDISTSHKEDKVFIDIQDYGVGISEEILERIFDPFFTTKKAGTGLGVSACYGIVNSHGGELTYTSEVGKGTTAHIILPVSAEK